MNRVFKFLGRDKDLSILGLVTTTVIVVLFLMLGSRLFSVVGLQSMSIQVSEFGFLALAMGLAMLVAGIDLSVVAAAGLAGVMAALTMSGEFIPVTPENETQVIILGVLVALGTGLLTGLLNGVIIAKLSVPPILATLGTMILYTGIGTAITSGASVSLKVPSFAALATSTLGPLPMVFVMLLASFILVSFILTRTRFGRKIYLFGENEVALRFSGIKSERVIIMTYAIIGLLVGLAAIVIIARANSMRVGFGESYLLQAILVVVLAGFSPSGGKGRVLNLGVALVLLQVISTAMTAFAFSPYAKNIVWGGILLTVMGMNRYLRARGPRISRPEPPTETVALALERSRRDV